MHAFAQVLGGGSDAAADSVRGYFGMRTFTLGKDSAGVTRPLLNNKPVFLAGYVFTSPLTVVAGEIKKNTDYLKLCTDNHVQFLPIVLEFEGAHTPRLI